MKKRLLVLLGLTLIFFVSCGNDESKETDNDEQANDSQNFTEQDELIDVSIDDDIDKESMDVEIDIDSESSQFEEEISDTIDEEPSDVDITEGMEAVAAGSFWMGCNTEVDSSCLQYSDQFPYHSVTLSFYEIDIYEVTAEEFQKCVDAGDCNNQGDNLHYQTNAEQSSCNLGSPDFKKHPMNCVSWYGAKAYCEWAGKRLPTEAEWEKVARGTHGQRYPWGNNEAVSCNNAVIYDDNGSSLKYGCDTGGTWPVGSKPGGIAPYGAYDMIGNVAEWVSDWYDAGYYTSSASTDPAGAATGTTRVVRGGSWSNHGDFLSVSYRIHTEPESLGDSYYGFRCAK